jgi:hypothetical protein
MYIPYSKQFVTELVQQMPTIRGYIDFYARYAARHFALSEVSNPLSDAAKA